MSMAADEHSLILHQYEMSPFSEKIRVIFGIKGLAWHACDQPIIMPKPELVTLTGGYRRIPVLQIGADLYFDTVLIIDELEHRFPEPSVYAGVGPGMAQALAGWSDQTLFWQVVTALFGGDIPPDAAFMADRSALLGRPFDPDAMKAAAPGALRQLAAGFDLVERQLTGGHTFLFGDRASAADASVYHNVAFLRWGQGRAARVLDHFPHVLAWEARMRAIGHGKRGQDVSRHAAIAIARGTEPLPVSAGHTGNGFAVGDAVTIHYHDANTPTLAAEFVATKPQSFCVRFSSAQIGTVNIHMPYTAGRMARV